MYVCMYVCRPKGVSGELVTPTGASLVRALCGMSALFRDVDQEVRIPIYFFGRFVPPV